MRFLLAIWTVAAALTLAGNAFALEHVTLRQGDKQIQVDGRVIVDAQDGGVMLLARDGVIWTVQPGELVRRRADREPFLPLTPAEMGERILAELPAGFDVHHTPHYVICYNTSRDYARWCGSLFERLYQAFTNFWSRRGFELKTPEFPLTAIVFADRPSYERFARAELKDTVGKIIGYYSLRTNRMTMFDLTGAASLSRGARAGTIAQINRILSQPAAEQMVATVVHEATHQIAFNCGLHTRFSDCPLWFSEGIAMYFETPDVTGARGGFSAVGAINRSRLARFLAHLERRPHDSLATLIRDDKRLRDPQQGLDAYAEAWALTYYLLKQHPKQYIGYLKTLSAKPPMQWDEPETRIGEFRRAFGDLQKLDAEMVRYMARLR